VFGSGFQDFLQESQSGQSGVVTSASAGNDSLKPERTREFEGGLDFGFLDQKVDLGLTYYNSKSTDVILQIPVNGSSTGFTAALANGAVITNKGWEATLNARPITQANFAWDFGLTFGKNDNRVVSLQGAQFVSYNNEGFTGSIGASVAGSGVGVVLGEDFARCGRGLNFVPSGATTSLDVDAACGDAPKGALYLAANGQPIVDPTQRVIANAQPDWSGGVRTNFRFYKKFQVSGLLDIRHGGTIWDGTRGALYAFGTHKDTDIRDQVGTFGQNFLTDVYPNVAGPGANQPAFSTPSQWQSWFTGNGGSGSPAQFQFVEDASFVKLREVSVAYTADQKWVQSIGFSSVDFRLAGRNLHTWSNYKGLDPESNLGGAEFLTQGIDYFNSPQTRSIVVSVGLNK
jgi:hypothetical protein